MIAKYNYFGIKLKDSHRRQKAICNCSKCNVQSAYDDVYVVREIDCNSREEVCPVCHNTDIWYSCRCAFCDMEFDLEEYDIDPERIECPFCENTGEIKEEEEEYI